PGVGAARGLPGPAADAGTVAATAAAPRPRCAPGGRPDERARRATGEEGLRAARQAWHGADAARDAPHRPEGAARPLHALEARPLRRSPDQRPRSRLGALG